MNISKKCFSLDCIEEILYSFQMIYLSFKFVLVCSYCLLLLFAVAVVVVAVLFLLLLLLLLCEIHPATVKKNQNLFSLYYQTFKCSFIVSSHAISA